MNITRPGILWVLVAVLVASVAAAVRADPASIASVEWGFAGNIPSGRWAPVRVWINSGDKPESGLLSIEYQQDGSQKAKVVVPVSVVPGTPTAVDVLVSLPSEADPITVRYTPSGGREQVLEYSPMPTGNQLYAPEVFSETRQMVLCVGTDAPLAALSNPTLVKQRPRLGRTVLGDHRSVSGEDLRELRWFQTAGVRMDVSGLPEDPHAYDGVAAVIIDAERAGLPGPRLRAALSEWVAAGGRLVLLSDRDGDAWRAWMPGEEPLPITLGEAKDLPSPEDLRKAAERGEAAELGSTGGEDDDQIDPAARRFMVRSTMIRKVKAFEAAVRASVKGREISIEPNASQSGWRGRLRISDGKFLVAEGPVGLGMVTVIGSNPSTIAADANPLAARAAWRLALTPVLDRYLTRPMSLQSMGQEALANVMDKVAGVPEVGRGMLYATVALLFLLALLLGVGDYFILGKLGKRHLSWGLAILWISLFSVGAAVVIPRIRSGNSSVDRAVCVDILQHSNDASSPASVWQTGVSGIFSGGPTELVSEERSGPGLLRGASAERDNAHFRFGSERKRVGLPAVEAVQVVMPGGERANVVMGLRQPPWTYRILTDDSKPQSRIRVTIENADTAGATVRVHGVGARSVMREAALQIEDQIYVWKAPVGGPETSANADGTIELAMTCIPNAGLRLEPEIRDEFGRVISGTPSAAGQAARSGRANVFGVIPNTSPRPNAATSGVRSLVGPEMYPASLAAAGDRQAALRARAAAGQAVFVADLIGPSVGDWLLRVKGQDSVSMNTTATLRVVVPMTGGKP